MPRPNKNDLNDYRVVMGKLKDDWTYYIRSVPASDRFYATVSHPCGFDLPGGAPWFIADPTQIADPAHPTYQTIEEAEVAARRYVDILSGMPGYPDLDRMSARGFRPTTY